MNATLPALPDDHGEWTRLRTMRMIGDYMEPTLRRGQVLGVLPTSKYECEGVYVIAPFGVPEIRRAQKLIGSAEILTICDNPAYSKGKLTVAQFEEIVVGRVVAVLTILDPVRLPI